MPAFDLDWRSLANADTTVVFYMALMNLAQIRRQLLDAGRPGETPVALIEAGTTQRQRCIHTTLEKLVQSAREQRVGSPTVVVVGWVAALGPELAWFEADGADETAQSVHAVGNHG
jgi:siroheme synthase